MTTRPSCTLLHPLLHGAICNWLTPYSPAGPSTSRLPQRYQPTPQEIEHELAEVRARIARTQKREAEVVDMIQKLRGSSQLPGELGEESREYAFWPSPFVRFLSRELLHFVQTLADSESDCTRLRQQTLLTRTPYRYTSSPTCRRARACVRTDEARRGRGRDPGGQEGGGGCS